MATEFPNSFKDPVYSQLDAKTEAKLGLPPGLLVSVRTNGEKSNHDQVSSAGAGTVYQFIPATRNAILKKYGIDVALSPENASEGAGLLLKEGLDRNRGDASQAVGEYIGGLNRNNWGKDTKAYVNRVMVGQNKANLGNLESGFAKFMAANPAVPAGRTADGVPGQLAPGNIDMNTRPRVKNADGSISTVRSMGVNIDGKEVLIPTVSDDGRVMSDQEAIKQYRDTGKHLGIFKDVAASDAFAEKLHNSEAAKLNSPTSKLEAGFGDFLAQQDKAASDAKYAAPEPGMIDKAIGTGEALLTGATGLTTGALGMAGGAIGGLAGAVMNGDFGTPEAAKQIEDAAAQGATDLTYQPKTASGKEQAAAAGEALAATVPVIPLTGELSALARAGGAAAPSVGAIPAAARNAAGNAARAVAEVPAKVAEMLPGAESAATPGTRPSLAAGGTDVAAMRRANAQGLPEPIALTEGQATRDYAQQRFERETAKDSERGAPLRDRFEQQNEAILKNFDQWVDQTGAEAPNLRQVGEVVNKALAERAKRDKTEINVKYAQARKSPEAKAPVDQNLTVNIGAGDEAIASTPLAFINEQPTGLPATALTDAARQYATRLGVADLVDGQLVPREGTTISQMEAWRKAINEATGYEPSEIRQATILKKLIDGQTEPVAGPLFRDARRAREVYANRYENVSVIKKLLDTKRGSNDRQVAYEDVFDHSIMKGSLDDVRQVRKTLQTAGPEGQKAWKELQGQTMKYIRDEAAGNTATDARGNVVISAAKLDKAVKKLDADGKLDFVFGKQGANQIRLINDVAKDVLTSPPNSVNTSNTASVLLAALDMGISGAGGMPLPIASGLRLVVNNIKDRGIRRRVYEALGKKTEAEKPAPAQRKHNKTIH